MQMIPPWAFALILFAGMPSLIIVAIRWRHRNDPPYRIRRGRHGTPRGLTAAGEPTPMRGNTR
jgi:hypothetical protein